MTILLTGVSRGVGAATAQTLTGAGHSVVGVYRSSHASARAVREACAGRLSLVAADLSTEEGIRAVVEAPSTREDPSAPYEGVVINAGVAVRAAFDDDLVEGIDPLTEQIYADLTAPLLLLRGLLKADRVARGASIVLVSSNLARHGLAGKVVYGAAKAGLEATARGLCKELGPRRIRVNAVAPGLLRTYMTAEIGDEGFAAYAKEVPLGRVGSPEDIAPVIAFLMSDDARYINGVVVDVDGGWGS